MCVWGENERERREGVEEREARDKERQKKERKREILLASFRPRT